MDARLARAESAGGRGPPNAAPAPGEVACEGRAWTKRECLAAIAADPEVAFGRVLLEAERAARGVPYADRADVAEELVEHVFEESRKGRESDLLKVSPDAPLLPYLRGVAHNKACSRHRRAQREREALERRGGSEVDPTGDPAIRAENEETRERVRHEVEEVLQAVRQAVEALPPELREVALGVLEGHRHRAIARKMGTSERTVGRRWTKSKELLRERLGFDPPAGTWKDRSGSDGAPEAGAEPRAAGQGVLDLQALAGASCEADWRATLRDWKYGPAGFCCPGCGGTACWHLASRGVDECRGCRKQTSLTSGTLFHGLREVGKALVAFHAFVTSPSAPSPRELAQRAGVTPPTARAWLDRFRQALGAAAPALCGEPCEVGTTTETVGVRSDVLVVAAAVHPGGVAHLEVIDAEQVAEGVAGADPHALGERELAAAAGNVAGSEPAAGAGGSLARLFDVMRSVLRSAYRRASWRVHLRGYLNEVAFRWRCLVAGLPTLADLRALLLFRPPRSAPAAPG